MRRRDAKMDLVFISLKTRELFLTPLGNRGNVAPATMRGGKET